MRPTANFALHAMLAAALAALAASSAAAKEAAQFSLVAASFKNAGGNSHAPGGQIEIQSWSWGPRQSTSTDGSHVKLQPGGGGAAAGQKDMVMKGSTIGENAPHGRWIPITQRPGLATGDAGSDGSAKVGVSHDVKSPRDAASGMPTGKRQHSPMKIVKQYDAGRLTLHGNLPGCAVGATYPDAVLQTASARYELKDVLISGCAPEGVSLSYTKVTVRGWDPEKKEE